MRQDPSVVAGLSLSALRRYLLQGALGLSVPPPLAEAEGDPDEHREDQGAGRKPYWQGIDGSASPEEIPAPEGRFALVKFKDFAPEVRGVDVALGWNRALHELVPK